MNRFFKFSIFLIISLLLTVPCYALDLDSTVNDVQRKNYTKTQQNKTVNQNKAVSQNKELQVEQQIQQIPQESVKVETKELDKLEVNPEPVQNKEKTVIKQDLPKVPSLPSKAYNSNVVPINKQYSGKVPNAEAIIPCNDIKVSGLIIDESVVKSKKTKIATQQTKTVKQTKLPLSYKTAKLAKGTQLRAINQSKISDYFQEGHSIVFITTQTVKTPYITIPQNTKLVAKVVDSHGPQISCNGGLVGLRIVSANINGYNQNLNGGVIKLKNDNIHFSNLKGEHTYWKTTCKKAKWGQNMYSKWSKTSHKLANNGAGVIIAPFPYIGGCVLAAASTVSSPVTAMFGKGGHLNIPPKTKFTIKLYDDAYIRLN